jgi:hypothetical protein
VTVKAVMKYAEMASTQVAPTHVTMIMSGSMTAEMSSAPYTMGSHVQPHTQQSAMKIVMAQTFHFGLVRITI